MKKLDCFGNDYYTSLEEDLLKLVETVFGKAVFDTRYDGCDDVQLLFVKIYGLILEGYMPIKTPFWYFTVILGVLQLKLKTPNPVYWLKVWVWNTQLWWLFVSTNNYSQFWNMFSNENFYFCEHEIFTDVF